jgi:predicted nucleic acid-binding protein
VQNPSASFLCDWIKVGAFTWLITEEILSEHKGVLNRIRVRRNLVGEVINPLRNEAEFVTIRSECNLSPDPDDNVFCACAEVAQSGSQ